MRSAQDLELRLVALEQQNKQLRRLGVAAAAIALALPLLSAFSPNRTGAAEVHANRFVLTDNRGQERGVFELDGKQAPRLVFLDPEGGDRIVIAADPQTAYILLKDQHNKNRLGMAVDAYPHLMLHDEFQMPRLHASVGVKGAASILFNDGKTHSLGLGIDQHGKIWRKPEIDREMEAKAKLEAEKSKKVVPPAENEAAEPPKKKDGDK